ncbi:MAG: hypothetical protein JRH20_03210 [Deltaproteobacteria bacterium]|nr:hypothetical protein [Deltaproteobacteria bacterium]
MRYAANMNLQRLNHVVRPEGELIHLYPRGETRHRGAVLAAWALGASLALAILAGLLSSQVTGASLLLASTAAVAACVGFIGLAMWRLASDRVTLESTGTLQLPTGKVTPGRAGAVHMSEARQAQNPHPKCFTVSLVLRNEGQTGEGQTGEGQTGEDSALMETLGQASASPSDLVEELAASSVEVTQHTDALSAWLTAETLAHALQVPLLDTCGEHALLRLHHELDLPLGERLRQQKAPPHPGDAPGRIQATLNEDGLHASWRAASPALALMGIFALLQLVIGLAAHVFTRTGLPLLLSGGVFALTALSLFALKRPYGLRVNPKGISLRPPWGREKHMPLTKLKVVRVSSLPLPRLLLMGDEHLASCHLPSTTAARWLNQAVEWEVSRTKPSANHVGPYR